MRLSCDFVDYLRLINARQYFSVFLELFEETIDKCCGNWGGGEGMVINHLYMYIQGRQVCDKGVLM